MHTAPVHMGDVHTGDVHTEDVHLDMDMGDVPTQDATARRWFQFNDERVVPMLESELQNAAGTSDLADVRRACAYMLLYRRKGQPSLHLQPLQ